MGNWVAFKNKWFVAFFYSHLFGWTVACLQTVWIVYEIRKLRKSGEK
jgi:hypothetical protein